MTTGQGAAPAAEEPKKRTIISRELAEFLIELSIAIHKHTMYPPGHPALTPSAQRVQSRLFRLLESRPVLSLGVARKQLVIEGVATDPENPVLRDLAARLHDHSLGAVEFERGVEAHELHRLFEVLLTDPDHPDGPFIQDLTKKLKPSPHITLFPMRYESLELLDDHDEDPSADSGTRTRTAQLWVGLAQAAMELEERDEGLDEGLSDPAAVAEAIREHPGTSAYDQVIVGYMLQIAEELRGAESGDAAVLRERMAALVDGLDEKTLGRLLTMGGDRQQRQQFLKQASQGMEVDAVIDLVTAANKTEGEGISQSLLRMLKKLAQQSAGAGPQRRRLAETSVRDQVRELIDGWSLEDPTPTPYAEALHKMTSATSFIPMAPEAQHAAEPDRIFQMAIEVNETGDAVVMAVDRLLAEGQAAWVLRGLRTAEAPTVVRAIREHVSQPAKVLELVDAESVDVEALELLLEQIGLRAVEPMLHVLKESEDQHKRRILIEQLVSLGNDVGPYVVAELNDTRWQVKRNMLHLLTRLDAVPDGFDPADYVGHSHPKVRIEAVRLMLRNPETRDEAMRHALSDPEQSLARLGLRAAIESSTPAAAPLIASKLRPTLPEELRVMAVRALGVCGGRVALKALLNVAAPHKRFFRWRTPRKSRRYIAALTALQRFRDDDKVAHALAVAARSRDAEIARAGRGPVN